MKLSICIPVYNFDVRELIFDLEKQIEKNGFNAEIILIDDASTEGFKKINKETSKKVEHFVFLEKNVGRSLIRNMFLYYAKGNYLLFLDCDGKIISPDFLKNYLDFIQSNPSTKVIYGGREVSPEPPEAKKYLRWKFAFERENLAVEQRKEIPYLSFQTNNFIVKKSVLEKVNFNPEFQKYGYEDLLFAMDLKAKNVEINHIDNPIFNNDLEENEVYLKKVEESVESLAKMLTNSKVKEKIGEVKLVKAYEMFTTTATKFWFQKLFSLRRERTKQKLLKGNVSLRYLDFYKLGLLFEEMENKQKNFRFL